MFRSIRIAILGQPFQIFAESILALRTTALRIFAIVVWIKYFTNPHSMNSTRRTFSTGDFAQQEIIIEQDLSAA